MSANYANLQLQSAAPGRPCNRELPASDGSPPFRDKQKVEAKRYDATNPKWNRMGICIVVGQRRARCESGWLVNIMAKDGTTTELDSHWLTAENAFDVATKPAPVGSEKHE